MPISISSRRVVAPLLMALTGCHLIDQRDFRPAGVAPSAAAIARSADLATAQAAPLVRVYPGDLGHDWRGDVLAAVRGALVHDANAGFDVVTPIPTAADADRQREAALTGSADAAAVAAVIEGDGVPAERITLGARGDAGNPPREVTVLVHRLPGR